MSDRSLADRFRWFADWCEGTSPLYERLARGVANDPELLALAAETPDGRSPPHLLLAGVHHLLLSGREHPLAAHYPTVADGPADDDSASGGSLDGDPASGDPAGDATPDFDPVPAFRAFCDEHQTEIRDRLRTRRTQTNSVRRCAALLPAFEHLSRRVEGPFSVVEVGPSAGLNLRWDRYRYEYAGANGGDVGPVDARVTVRSRVRGGDPPLPDDPPTVAGRVGIDLNPLDVRDPGDATWLRALVWPEHEERHRLLRRAIAAARDDPPELVAGDAVERLPAVVADLPDGPVCVVTTQVLYQFDDATRERFEATLADLAAERELHWLSGDEPTPDRERAIRLRHVRPGEGERALLNYDQHGAWVEWLADG